MKTKKLKSRFIRCLCTAFALILCIQSFGGFASASNTVTFSEEETAFINAVEGSASAGKINHWGAWNNAVSSKPGELSRGHRGLPEGGALFQKRGFDKHGTAVPAFGRVLRCLERLPQRGDLLQTQLLLLVSCSRAGGNSQILQQHCQKLGDRCAPVSENDGRALQ